MKTTHKAICMLLIMVGLYALPARAQLASYVDDRGNLVYINANPPASRTASAKGTKGPVAASKPVPAPAASITPSKADVPPAPMPEALSQIVQQSAEKHNVPPELVRAVISTESNWNALAVSPKGALGLMQLVPGTAQLLGVGNAFDPAQNVDAGVRYLGMMLERYNYDIPKALAAYNAGPGVVDRFGGVPNYRETRNYVQKVTSIYFQPGPDGQPRVWGAPGSIHRTTDAGGRVVFTNE
jgi:soluble lytic murein transglycosylase-like protein